MSMIARASRYRGPAAPVNPPPSGPAWYTGATIDQWGTWSGSALSASGVGWTTPPNTSPGGTSNYTDVVSSWSTAWKNTYGVKIAGVMQLGTSMNIWGAGHSTWYGNEIYTFWNFENTTPVWARLTDPTVPGPTNVARDGSNNPVARHTYASLVYDKTNNEMVTFGCYGRASDGGSFNNNSDKFTHGTNVWTPNDTGAPAYDGGGIGPSNLKACENPVTRISWAMGYGNNQTLASYNHATATFTNYIHIDNASSQSNTNCAIDTVNNVMAWISTSNTLQLKDLNNPTVNTVYTATVTGATIPSSGAIAYDPVGKQYLIWSGTGKTITKVKVPASLPLSGTYVATAVTPAGGATPGNQTTNGTYGRFMVLDAPINCAVLMTDYNTDLLYWRLS